MKYKLTAQTLLIFKSFYGIGLFKSRILLNKCGLNVNYNFKIEEFLFNDFYQRIRYLIYIKNWLINKKLKQRIRQYFVYLMLLKNYKFIRLKYFLPINGQRSHSNAKTIKKNIFFQGLLFMSKNKTSKLRLLKIMPSWYFKKAAKKTLKTKSNYKRTFVFK